MRAEIRLVKFNLAKGTEPGKIRPCLVIQSDLPAHAIPSPLPNLLIIAWLDSLDGEPFSGGEYIVEFSDEAWKSAARKDQDVS